MTENEPNLLFRVISTSLKYFLLALASFGIVFLVSITFGAIHLMNPLLPLLGGLIVRVGAILLSLLAITMIHESLR
ncbi:hypothetical protein WA1_29970 [Scytonema hofmannii PCC 7110]|uniref:Uncharacterized protein n=1 Tax=Scytonema hofmannii PCC 7110 TaxID=128403 RepID=A0A139X587_9CYAN|nr:hypothetical protein [Scytonema hofmannii]KYC39782.1 hypothetical protein WA1_29970 [Scytonema hofmannii PCC 7110]